MRLHALFLCCAALLMGGCADSRPQPAGDADAGQAGDDVNLVVVDAGPSRPVTATIETPPNDLVVSQQSDPAANLIPLAIELEGEEPDSVQLAVNGTPEDVLAPPYHYEWDISGRPEGNYRVSAWAIIGERAYPGPARTITIDDDEGFANINLEMMTPASRRSVDRSLLVILRANGMSANGSFELFADGEKVATESSSGRAEFELSTADWPTGPVELQARVTIDDREFWSLPRTVDVIHRSSDRFVAVGEALEDWRTVDIAVGPDGRPVVALTTQNAIAVYAFSEQSGDWSALGGTLAEQWEPGLPDVEIATDGTIYVAWSQPDPTEPWNYRRNVYAARWDAGDERWIRMGDHLERQRELDASSALMWTDASDIPHVALAAQNSSGEDTLEVLRWDADDEQWETLGLPFDAPARAGTIALGRDPDDELHLVWRSNFRVFTHRFSTRSNVWLANARPTLDGFALDAVWRGDALTVPVFGQSGFRMVETDGVQWTPLEAGAHPKPESISAMGGVAMDDSGGLNMAWLRYQDSRDLLASQLVDAQWAPLADRPIQSTIDADVESADIAFGGGRLMTGFVVRDADGWRVEVREFTE